MNSCVNTLRLFRILLHLIVIGLCISRARLRFSFFFVRTLGTSKSFSHLIVIGIGISCGFRIPSHSTGTLLFLLLKHFKHRFEIKRSLISRELFIS